MTLSMLATTAVDTYLVAKDMYPSLLSGSNTEDGEQRLQAMISTLAAQLDPRSDEQLEAQREEAREDRCDLVKIGTSIVTKEDSPHKGREYDRQMRCSICHEYGRTERASSTRAPRTTFKCSKHPDVYICKRTGSTCWQGHLAGCLCD